MQNMESGGIAIQGLLATYPIIGKILPWVGGAIGGYFIFLLRNRRATLAYSVSHQRIGLTAHDEIHGHVEVRYRGDPVQNLYLSVVRIENRSARDIENLNIKTYRGSSEMAMLTEQTHILDTIEIVDLADEYLGRITADAEWEAEIAEQGGAELPENASRISSNFAFRHGQRHYSIPVLNRGQVATLSYLTTTAATATPSIYLTSQTKGVRVVEKRFPQSFSHILGVPLQRAARVGLVIGIGLATAVVWYVESLVVAASVCFLVGLFAAFPGALAIKAYEWFRRNIIG